MSRSSPFTKADLAAHCRRGARFIPQGESIGPKHNLLAQAVKFSQYCVQFSRLNSSATGGFGRALSLRSQSHFRLLILYWR